MRHFYFVRHGESETNARFVYDGPESKLTKRGEKQSRFLAKRFLTIPLEGIVASTYLRTRKTAELFNEELGHPIHLSELFCERRWPTRLIGMSREDPSRKGLINALRNADRQGAQYEDNESVEELKARGQKALAFLLGLPYQNVVVITHGYFIRMLTSLMLFGNQLTSQEFSQIALVLKTKNTGITVTTCSPDNPSSNWQILAWNDHAHLGDA